MSELLTSRDLETKTFGRALRGYAPDEVDEFLDRAAEDIQQYSLRCADLERQVERLREQILEYDNLKETLQGTLLMAQKSAEAKEDAASRQADAILSEARLAAKQILAEATAARDGERREIQRLRQIRQETRAEFRSMLSRFAALVDGEEDRTAGEDDAAR
ncbi:hypothetical protein MASR2M79_00930 [Aminivibrio sp.]|nr:DivIVA domain-containing protein [Synergistaceae bacterium]